MRRFPLLQLARPVNGLIAALGVFVGAQFGLQGSGLEWTYGRAWSALATALSTALILSAGNALNDAADAEIDRVNRPERAIPSGRATVQQARRFAAACVLTGLLFAALVSLEAFRIAVGAAGALAAYAAFLKRMPLAGNLTVAFLTSAAFYAGGVAVEGARHTYAPIVFIFLFTAARELVKDIEDMEGDALHGARTAPIVWGKTAAQTAASAFAALGVLWSPIPFLLEWRGFGPLYLAAVTLGVNLPICWTFARFWRGGSARQTQRTLKTSAVFGLLAVYIG